MQPHWKIKMPSLLAENFFLKLVHPDPTLRMTANQSKSHPFITGKQEDEIPLTHQDCLESYEN